MRTGTAQSQLVLYLCLHHGGSLSSQRLDGLEEVHHSLVSHPLQHNAQRDENTRPSYTRTDDQTST